MVKSKETRIYTYSVIIWMRGDTNNARTSQYWKIFILILLSDCPWYQVASRSATSRETLAHATFPNFTFQANLK